jgi:teichuronic acid biosynthesis glycosyltransferase TuaC
MRILLVLGGYGDEHLGGSIHGELAEQVLAAGHECSIYAPVHARYAAGSAEESVEDGVRIHRAVCAGRTHLDALNALSAPLFHFPWFVTSLWGFRRALRRNGGADVVFVESAYPFGAQVEIATRRSRTPFIASVIGGDFIANHAANYGYGRYAIARRLMDRTFRRAAVVRAVSPHAARSVAALGCPGAKIAVAQRNIARSCFLPEDPDAGRLRVAARERVTARFGVQGKSLVVAAGRLVPIKGFDTLLRALPLSDALREAAVLIVGPDRRDSHLGDYRHYLSALAASLGVAPQVVLTGALPHAEVKEVLAGADVVAIPSVEEGGSKMVMEAAAVGAPVVATRKCGTAEWASAWRCASVVEPSDPRGLARALEALLCDPAAAAEMSRRARPFAENFRPEPVARRILALCRVAAEGAPLPADLRAPRRLLDPAAAD